MIFRELDLAGAYVVELERREDSRGWFARAWDRDEFAARGLETHIVQANLSFNRQRGTLRGLHFQAAPHAEVKMVRCTRGAIHDVIVDLRGMSATYGQWIGLDLTPENGRMLYVPKGFAHGYQTLVDDTEVAYQVTAFYEPGSEGGVRWNDPALSISWPIPEPVAVSDRDRAWPNLGAQGETG